MTDIPKACPFCGNKNLRLGTFPGYAPIAGRCFVHCEKCHTSGPLSRAYEYDDDLSKASLDAVHVWNRRMNDED